MSNALVALHFQNDICHSEGRIPFSLNRDTREADAFIGASLVPDCAMTVQRSAELGPLSAYAPPFQCGCYFEASPNVSGTAPEGCTACTTSADCTDPARPACNLGYCEVQ